MSDRWSGKKKRRKEKKKREESTYLRWVRLLGLVVEGLRAAGHGVPTGCRGAILRGADELDSSTLDDDVGGGWKILCVTERVAVAQEPGFLPVQGVDLSETVGKDALSLRGLKQMESRVSNPSTRDFSEFSFSDLDFSKFWLLRFIAIENKEFI